MAYFQRPGLWGLGCRQWGVLWKAKVAHESVCDAFVAEGDAASANQGGAAGVVQDWLSALKRARRRWECVEQRKVGTLCEEVQEEWRR